MCTGDRKNLRNFKMKTSGGRAVDFGYLALFGFFHVSQEPTKNTYNSSITEPSIILPFHNFYKSSSNKKTEPK